MMYALFALATCLPLCQNAVACPCSDHNCQQAMVMARDSNEHVIEAQAGELVHIDVEGDGSTDLELVVIDEDVYAVAIDDSATDRAVMSFTAPRTGEFIIYVSNYGDLENEYTICVQ